MSVLLSILPSPANRTSDDFDLERHFVLNNQHKTFKTGTSAQRQRNQTLEEHNSKVAVSKHLEFHNVGFFSNSTTTGSLS